MRGGVLIRRILVNGSCRKEPGEGHPVGAGGL